MRVLIVEDDSIQRRQLEHLVTERGYPATPCACGESAYHAFRRQPFDIVLLDWVLPGMTGLDWCRQMRALPGGRECVVLMVTGRDRIEDLHEALLAGVDDFLVKPMDVPLLGVRLEIAEARVWELRARAAAEAGRLRVERHCQAMRRMESLGLLAGGVAHDFNNLLVAIVGHAGLALLDLEPESPLRSHLENIEHAAERARGLTNHLLAYAGRGSVACERTELNAAVADAVDAWREEHETTAEIDLVLAAPSPETEVDPTMIGQVVEHLVSNAANAMSERGVIRVSTGRLDHQIKDLPDSTFPDKPPPGPYAVLEVQDDGCGIEPAVLARIFDPFFTTDPRRRGLGLASVMGVVRICGGAVTVESEPGVGTTVRVLLSRVDAIPAPGSVEVSAGHGGIRDAVVVVDDTNEVRGVVRVLLSRHGIETLGCDGLDDARAIIADNSDRLLAVLIDERVFVHESEIRWQELQRDVGPAPAIVYGRDGGIRESALAIGLNVLTAPFPPGALLAKLRVAPQAV